MDRSQNSGGDRAGKDEKSFVVVVMVVFPQGMFINPHSVPGTVTGIGINITTNFHQVHV